MTTSKQKQRELYFLEIAFRLLKIDNYSILDANGESPDFIVGIDGHEIGVEVVEIPRPLQKHCSAKTQADLPWIANRVVEILNEREAPASVLFIGFNGNAAVGKRDIAASELAAYIYENSKASSAEQVFDLFRLTPNIERHPALSFVRYVDIQSADGARSSFVILSGFDSIPLGLDVLKKAIDTKAVRLQKYRERCSKTWLLVVLPAMTLAGDFRLPNSGAVAIDSKFDAIYLLDEYRNEAVIVGS